jgi:hypothetical protein
MSYRSWSEHRAKPRTYVGQWLRAAFLRQRELRKELQATLNGGVPGWNNDEPAVVKYACQAVVRQLFGNERNIKDIMTFVEDLQTATKGDPPIDQRKAGSLIREALGIADIDASDIDPGQQFVLTSMIAGTAAMLLDLDEAAVDEIITESERIAFEHGWKPRLVRDKGLR